MKLHLSRSNMQNSNISVHEIFQCGSTTLEREKSFLVIDQLLRVQKLAKLSEENNLRTEGEFILSKYEKHFVVESLQTKQHSSRSTENHKLCCRSR